jgi:hypothetical protein
MQSKNVKDTKSSLTLPWELNTPFDPIIPQGIG